MLETLSNMMLIFIVGAVCCILLGGIITALRIVRFIRRERSLENEIRSKWMAEAREMRKDAKAK